MAMKASTAKLIASDFATLDLKRLRSFITEAVAEGAIALLISTIIGLLTRMRDLNQELARQLAWKNRKRPASETTHRLQLELPFALLATPEPPANDTSSGSDEDVDDDDDEKPKRKKRKKPDQTNRDAHGRPKFPEHIPRVEGDVELVTGDARICPHCSAECEHVTFKVCQKLDIEPARYVVREDKREVVACQHCHEHAATAPKRDEVRDRGVLGNELLVQSLVDHYQDAVPWERMERKARQEDIPLAANTLAASCGRVIDLFDPIVRHVFKRCMESEYVALDATSARRREQSKTLQEASALPGWRRRNHLICEALLWFRSLPVARLPVVSCLRMGSSGLDQFAAAGQTNHVASAASRLPRRPLSRSVRRRVVPSTTRSLFPRPRSTSGKNSMRTRRQARAHSQFSARWCRD